MEIVERHFPIDIDGGGGGTLDQLLAWWQELQKSGPLFGYFPKASKT